jgi:hypothetical protein
VTERARPYHEQIWETCSTELKFALGAVATDGFISRCNPDLKPLLKRGLLVRSPSLRLMDESFARFVREECFNTSLMEWGKEGHRSNWGAVKGPLFAMLAFVAAFLLLTQRDLFSDSVTFVTTLSAGLVALTKLLDMFTRPRPAASAKTE